jgi:ethanolamine kinase
VSFDNDVEKQSLLEALNLPQVRAGLLALLASQHAERTSSALALFQALPADAPLLSEGEGGDALSALSAAVLATQPVLCHNDLLSGNILLSNNPAQLMASSKEGVTLIDFEYAGFNPRAYDLANHFNEFAGFDFDIAHQFPTEEVRFSYLAHYLDAAASAASPASVEEGSDEHAAAAGRVLARWVQLRQGGAAGLHGPCLALVAALDRCVLQYLPASHVFWASWSVVQAANSTIDFDFLSYSKMRLDAVAFHRNLFSI